MWIDKYLDTFFDYLNTGEKYNPDLYYGAISDDIIVGLLKSG